MADPNAVQPERAPEPPPGWYADPNAPAGRTGVRWWSGVGWTEHVVADPPGPALTPDGVRVAGVGRRIGAYTIDTLVSGTITVLLGLPFVIAIVRSAVEAFRGSMDAARAGTQPTPWSPYGDAAGAFLGLFALGLAVTVLYHVLFLRWRAATPGKLAVGLEVRAWDGTGPLGWGAILRRLLGQFWHVLLQPVAVVGTIAGAWALVDNLFAFNNPHRRTLHDRFAGTVVVDARTGRSHGQPGQQTGPV